MWFSNSEILDLWIQSVKNIGIFSASGLVEKENAINGYVLLKF